MTTPSTPPRHPLPEPSDPGVEWRWRNYSERLTDLYDLPGGTGAPLGSRGSATERDAPHSGKPRR